MVHDLADGAGARMRIEHQILFCECYPDEIQLVYLTGIGPCQMLKKGNLSTGNVSIFNSSILVLHDCYSRERYSAQGFMPSSIQRLNKATCSLGHGPSQGMLPSSSVE